MVDLTFSAQTNSKIKKTFDLNALIISPQSTKMLLDLDDNYYDAILLSQPKKLLSLSAHESRCPPSVLSALSSRHGCYLRFHNSSSQSSLINILVNTQQ